MKDAILVIEQNKFDVTISNYPIVTVETIELAVMGGRIVPPFHSDTFLNWVLGRAGKPRTGVTIERVMGRQSVEPIVFKIQPQDVDYFRNWVTDVSGWYEIHSVPHEQYKRNCKLVSGDVEFELMGTFPIEVELNTNPDDTIECIVTLRIDH